MRYVFPFVAITFLAAGCDPALRPHAAPENGQARSSPVQQRGALEKLEHLRSYARAEVQTILKASKFPELGETYNGIELYRITYWTEDRGKIVLASGLMSVPQQNPLLGVVSYHHGTRATRAESPSTPTQDEAVLLSGLFAGARYLFVAPDYVGYGVSKAIHPYFYAPSTANAAVDLLKAAREATASLKVKWNPALYLFGFSQGGHATALTQRALEALGDPTLQVRAAASIAGPFDLAKITVPYALEGHSESDSFYLAYMVRAYSEIYGQRADTVLRPPYAEQLATLFDGEHESEVVEKALPRNPREMFQPGFLQAFDAGRATWFGRALAENEAYNWSPKAPLRLYFGENDVDVPAADAHFAAEYMKLLGGNVELMPLGPYDHGGTVFHALGKIRHWFDECADRSATGQAAHRAFSPARHL